MVVTITALLCSHLIVYAQPMQNMPIDGADVTIPVEFQWATSSAQATDIEMYNCALPSPNEVALDEYEFCDAVPIEPILPDSDGERSNLSGITYNPLTNTLFIAQNDPTTVYETTLSGDLLRTITLTGFDDTEGIVHLGGTQYAVTEERVGKITTININASTLNVNHSNASVQQLPGIWSGNDGLEGVSYNPTNNTIHTLKERTSKAYYSFSKSASPLTNSNVTEPCGANPFSTLSDLAGTHHLGLTTLPNLNVSTHTLILSENSKRLIEIDGNCAQKSQLLLSAGGANGTLNTAIPQPEGVTMDNNGNLYIISEPNLLYIFIRPPAGTLIHTAAVAGTTYEIPISLQIGTEYCWRIKNSDECAWSPLRSFKPIDPCSAAYLQQVGCDDNDDCTINDVKIVSNFDGSVCTPCAGTSVPSSCTNGCFTFQACDDGNSCTENDTEGIAADGVTVCVPCMGTVNPSACDALCVTVQNCNDGDPLTTNDMESVAQDGSICSACAGVPVAACSNTTTQSCDDNNPCTQNDVETISNLNGSVCMPCMGTTDASSCDAACVTIQNCDDGNPLTINDMETLAADNSVCVPCAGTLVNACDYTTVQSCNDNEVCTEGDVETVSILDGTVCVPCAGQVNPASCNASCTTTQSCDDGNPCTKNDTEVVASDGSVCVPCAGIIDLSACHEDCPKVDFACDDNNPCTENDMETRSLNGTVCVPCAGTLIIDSNCACATEQQCNDGNLLTLGDVIAIATDGTVCEPCTGTPICDIFPPFDRACDDGDDCTEDDIEYYISTANGTAICVPCEGTFMDDDNDGVCNAEDTCPNADDNVDIDGNGIPDACDDECPEDLIIIDADVPGNYEAVKTITTDESTGAVVLVDVGEQLELNAGYYVKLTPGFNATDGSTMRAYIQACEPSSQKIEQSTLASVTHYPNPFKDEVTLEFNLQTDAEAQIIVSDVNGRTISQIEVGNLTRGIQTHSISTQDWISGIYFYQVQIREKNTGILNHANGTLVKM